MRVVDLVRRQDARHRLVKGRSDRRKREAAPKALNHQGKLLKELAAAISLRQPELKQLKMLADEQNVLSPMTLILCPSVLATAVKQSAGKVDRQTILQIARKLR